jgi:small conductance mechanosensitive channel
MEGKAAAAAKNVGGSLALAWVKVDTWIDGFYSILPNLVLGLIFLILVAIAARVVKSAVWRVGIRRHRSDLGNVLGALLQWTLWIVGTLVAITIIVPSVGVADLLGTLGIGSIAIGLRSRTFCRICWLGF